MQQPLSPNPANPLDLAENPREESREERALQLVYEVLTSATIAPNTPVPDELRDIKNIDTVFSMLWAIRNLSLALSKGELDYMTREKGFVVGTLKTFQSNLLHLTWQTQCIAKGEYNHRVNFMGDFAAAFNRMAEQLDNTINTLTSISEEYKDLSHRDPLTGFFNRFGFFKYAEQTITRAPRQSSSLIIADIDKFKSINDSHGHLCGDEVLRSFSAKLLAGLRTHDLCCRYGGEEFLIFMPGTALPEGRMVAERLRGAVEAMVIPFEEKRLKITSSFGIVPIVECTLQPSFEEEFNLYIQKADTELYTAKSEGRNRVSG